MQCLSLDVFHIWVVQVVSDKGKAQIFHMDTDLMSAACLQDKGDEAVSVLFFYDPASQMETLEEAAMVHGIDSVLLVEKINAAMTAAGK